ncbi:MAG: PilW family protein [Gammaproteobacteria bacterium]
MNRSQAGYTLIELMISSVLGLMMIAGFGSLFSQSQKSYTIQRSLSYMMEDGRYMQEVFGKEFRRAGFLRSKYDENNLLHPGDRLHVFLDESSVLESTIDFSAGDYIKGDSNSLMLRYQLNDADELAENDPSSDNSPCTRNIHLEAGEDPAINRHVVTLYFYVANDDSNVPVLYCKAKREDLDDHTKDKPLSPAVAAAEPLISNVQQLAITYGIDSEGDGAANYYTDAGNVINWQQVIAARLSVVLRSEDDNLTTASVGYTVDGTSYTATDNRLYRVYSTTIAFRNPI